MARMSRTQYRGTPPNYQPPEQMISLPLDVIGLDGMDRDSMLNEMPLSLCRLVRNMAVRKGSYEVRDGTSVVGTQASADLLAVYDIELTDGTVKRIRWKTNGVERYAAGVWIACGGTAWSGLDQLGIPFAITGWGDTVLFTCGVGKVFELNLTTNNLAELTDSPEDVIHLTTFGSRVVATTREGIYWTISKDSTDWTGLGSGFEDLKSAPGGVSDLPTAVIPITDELAGHIRSGSIWQMTLTGDFDAPFAFSKLPHKAGSLYPQSCVGTGSSIMCVGDDGAVWLITLQEAIDVGQRVRSIIQEAQYANIFHPGVASWNPRYKEYLLVATSEATQRVLRYRTEGGQWTEDTFDFPIRNLSYSLFKDSAVGGIYKPGMLYAMGDTWGYVVRDDPSRNNELYRDVNNLGIAVVGTFRIETGHIRRTDDGLIKDIYEMILWYKTEWTAVLKFLYSVDEGATWTNFFDISIASDTPVQQLSLTIPPLSRPYIQLAISCNATCKLRINKFQAWMIESGRSVDAS